MERKILLSADTPCDIGNELKERYQVSLYPLHIILEGRQYTDGLDISPDMLYEAWYQRKALPKTAAINPGEYADYFRSLVEQGYDVLHISSVPACPAPARTPSSLLKSLKAST